MDIFELKKRLACAALGMAACAALVACGGGGGIGGVGGGTPSAPALSLTPQSAKTFHFSWTPVGGATRYVLLEDADGTSGYQPVSSDDLPANASSYDHTVFLPERINARYVLQACNANGCADSVAVGVSGHLEAAVGYVKAAAQKLIGNFGASLAMSSDGTTMAVGAPGDDSADLNPLNSGASRSGAVYVFVRSGGAWQQQGYLKASNIGFGDNFGD